MKIQWAESYLVPYEEAIAAFVGLQEFLQVGEGGWQSLFRKGLLSFLLGKGNITCRYNLILLHLYF